MMVAGEMKELHTLNNKLNNPNEMLIDATKSAFTNPSGSFSENLVGGNGLLSSVFLKTIVDGVVDGILSFFKNLGK